jgi:uncharacterized protein
MVKIQSLTFEGPVGQLEGLLKFDDSAPAKALAVVCHPHPLFQGTMHNKVVFAVAESFFELGCEVLRFNFRGVGLSSGKHDHGCGEIKDALSAVDYLRSRHAQLACHIAGFSFGAGIAVQASAMDRDLASLTAVAPPFRNFDPKLLQGISLPKLFLQGTADEICPPAQLQELFPLIAQPKALALLEQAGHFFTGHLTALKTIILEHRTLLGIPA